MALGCVSGAEQLSSFRNDDLLSAQLATSRDTGISLQLA
jgi:hypothetical protein